LQLWKSAEQIFGRLVGRAVVLVVRFQTAIDDQHKACAWRCVGALNVSWLYGFILGRLSRLCHSDILLVEINIFVQVGNSEEKAFIALCKNRVMQRLM
jgi:hypothetical protein